jgi:hypothetical protein
MVLTLYNYTFQFGNLICRLASSNLGGNFILAS